MELGQIISTIVGGFLFPFLIATMWGRLVEAFGPIGGWMAAAFIVGTMWAMNHGLGMIYQSGTAWLIWHGQLVQVYSWLMSLQARRSMEAQSLLVSLVVS